MACRLVGNSLGLLELPDEMLVHILSYLSLDDLVTARLVCSRFHRLTESDSYAKYLWKAVSLDGAWINDKNLSLFERAATQGNMEALIKLAVAYLYSEGVEDGPGKGTVDSINGRIAAEYLCRAESLRYHRQPFAWALIRPPFANTCVCCKACVCMNMKKYCTRVLDGEEDSGNVVSIRNILYSIGKAMSFHADKSNGERGEVCKWFDRGSDHGCPHSAYERWKSSTEEEDELGRVRALRQIAAMPDTSVDAQFELCKCYARGQTGGLSRPQSYQYIRQLVCTSKLMLPVNLYDVQSDLTFFTMFVLIDWLVEVAEMKEYSSRTVHLAVSLVQRYLMLRDISKARLQLLGVSAMLLASRWTDTTIITIREAAWLTDCFMYQDVVCMMGELVAVLGGDIQEPIVPNYLEVFGLLSKSNDTICHFAAYISEVALFYGDVFGKYSSAMVAAACLLLARVVLGQEHPWPSVLREATGYRVIDLFECVSQLYNKCLTDEYTVIDERGVMLDSVKTRYAHARHLSVSEIEPEDFQDIKLRLGIHVLSQDTSFSFAASKSSLGDSQYCTDDSYVSQSFVDHFGTQCLSESGSASPRCMSPDGMPHDSYSLQSGTISPIHCSPPCSLPGSSCSSPLPGSSCSSPLSSSGEGASGCSSIMSPASSNTGTSSRRSFRLGNFSISKDAPSFSSILPGIEPLHSEETVGFNPLSASTSSVKRQRRQSFNQENSIFCKSTPKKSRQVLAAIENIPPTHDNKLSKRQHSKKTNRRFNLSN